MMNCSNKYWEKIQFKKIYMTTVFLVFAFTLILLIWKYDVFLMGFSQVWRFEEKIRYGS